MHKPSSFISSITLVAFLQAQIASVWALPEAMPGQKPAPTLLYLGDDPYTQALLKLEYDSANNSLEWQLLSNGLMLTSQSHALPEATESVNSAVVFDGDQIVVAGRTSSQNWFIRALSSQGELQWQRNGEGQIYDLAFSGSGEVLYAVGIKGNQPLFLVTNSRNGVFDYDSGADSHAGNSDAHVAYKQVVVTGNKEVIVAEHQPANGQLRYIKWQTVLNLQTFKEHWHTVSGFCQSCDRQGVISVALKSDSVQNRFFVIVSDEHWFEILEKEAITGANLTSRTIPLEHRARNWVGVLRASSDFVNLTSMIDLMPLTDLQLAIVNSECYLSIIGGGIPKEIFSINVCESSKTGYRRRKLLQAPESSPVVNFETPTPATDSEEGTLQNILTTIEVAAGIIGILTGFTLITGCLSFLNKQRSSYLENLSSAKNIEIQRRKDELGLLKDLKYYRHLHFLDFHYEVASLINQPKLNNDEGEPLSSLDRNPKSIVLGVINRISDKSKANSWLKEHSMLVNVQDELGNTALHLLSSLSMTESGWLEKYRIQEATKILLESGSSLSIPNHASYSPLEMAAQFNNKNLFATMLTWKQYFTFSEVSRLFHIAINLPNSDILLELYKRGLHHGVSFTSKRRLPWFMEMHRAIDEKSIQDEGGQTILHQAVNAKNQGAISVIIRKGEIPVNVRDSNRNTPLHLAAISGNLDAVNILLDEHASVKAQNLDGNTPLHLAAIRRGNKDVIKALKKKGADLTATNTHKKRPLDIACEHDNAEYIHEPESVEIADPGDEFLDICESGWIEITDETFLFMINAGMHNALRRLGKNRLTKFFNVGDRTQILLETILENGDFTTLDILITMGIDTTSIPAKGFPLLRIAARNGLLDLARTTIKNTPEINVDYIDDDPLKQTLLHEAIILGNSEIATLLIENKANVNHSDEMHETPLHQAAHDENIEIARVLIAHGAKKLARNLAGQTPVEIAREKNNHELVELLEQ